MRTVVAILVLTLAGCVCILAEEKPAEVSPAVVELLEDEADALIKQLGGAPGGEPGEAKYEAKDRYSGVCAVRVTPLQRYSHKLKGWRYPIAEKPKASEYRYVRFAWKKLGGSGIMVQFCGDDTSWEHRYVAGQQTVPWRALQVAEKMPEEWTVVTRDLFKDFGGFTLAGFAMTPMDGTAGLFDHVYLGRTVEDLDRVALGMGKKQDKELPRARLDKLWDDLLNRDAAVYGPARWALVSAAAQSPAYLQERLRGPTVEDKLAARVKGLIAKLDDDDFQVREDATAQLQKLGAAAVPFLKAALAATDSAEVRRRIEDLLGTQKGVATDLTPEQERTLRVVRVLEQIGTKEARTALQKLVEQGLPETVQAEAKAALTRLER